MANTQGMPDEFVESLMNTTNRGSSSGTARQRKWLQERMEMPLPEGRPAARIIRPSPQSQMRREEPQEEEELVQQPQNDGEQTLSIVGSIQERTPTAARRLRQNNKPKSSRFAQSLNGFPSVHVPLGTFCREKSGAPPQRPAAVVTPKPRKLDATITTESLLDASKQDASEMLHGMSQDEITQHQLELKASLSPEMVAFLKQRGGKQPSKQAHATSVSKIQNTSGTPAVAVSMPKRNTRQEKERLAEIMSKVQTYQDLDQAYHAFMKEPHPLEDPIATTTNSDDFALACDLLRSTNPRQTLWAARVVQRFLSDSVEQHQQTKILPVRHWPLLMPVSLRCLLDQPIQANTGYILHTYVLQSIHSLLLLTAHPDHIVYVLPTDQPSPAAVYVDCFMDDAIPTPRLDTAYLATPVKPLTATDNSDKSRDDTTPTGAYSTQSSSTSAQADAEAFDRDPMWTLLSKMKIVPRVAQLLNATSETYDWPPEAWISTLGILCMIAQRSPGAASAIAHHDIILPRIVARVLPCLQNQENPDESEYMIPHAAFQLMGTLARQSRVIAQSLPLVDILPPLLARTASNHLEFKVQKLGIYLWRTVLRYGLGLEAWESMTTGAARHLALPYSQQYSLSTEFVSALTQVLECAKLAKLKGEIILSGNSGESKLQASSLATLSMATTYLVSTQRTVMLQSTTPVDSYSVDAVDECLRFRWYAARMRFLANYWSLSELHQPADRSTTTSDVENEEWSMEQVLTCLQTMDEWTDVSSLVELAWTRLRKYASLSVCTDKTLDLIDLKCEAAASSFLQAFVQLLLSLGVSLRSTGNRMVQELARSVTKHFLERTLEGLRRELMRPSDSMCSTKSSLAQRGWINQSHFAISKAFSHYVFLGETLSSADIHLIRMMIFTLLGRLERGNESMAAVLFSQDVLFQAAGSPQENVESSTSPPGVASSSSPISSMFLGELCGSENSRKQLDHSFKLQHGFGVTQDGVGAFALDSLLSDASQPTSGPSLDLCLPLGTMWLWQCLSGQIRIKDEQMTTQGFSEANNVVSAVLGLLMELEQGEDLLDFNSEKGYAARIPLGAKLYYLMNVCLNTEEVLRDDRVLYLAEAVLERYWPKLNSSTSILEFSSACLEHTEPSNKIASDDALEEKDQKLLELFQPDFPNEISLPSKEMRSLEAFLDDMAEAYNDYGAQYDFFTKCVRLFLLPVFPSSIRCRALRELRGIFHLLTVPTELEHPEELQCLLCHSIANGQDDKAFSRDRPEFLDAITTITVPNSGPRPLTGFMLAFSVAIMARNLGMALYSNDGLDTLKNRLIQLDNRTIDLICMTLSYLNGPMASQDDLIKATLQSLSSVEATLHETKRFLSTSELDEHLTNCRKHWSK